MGVDYLASQKLVEPTAATDRETLFSVMKDFTKKEIGVIIKEEFEERMSSLLTESEGLLSQLSGSRIMWHLLLYYAGGLPFLV